MTLQVKYVNITITAGSHPTVVSHQKFVSSPLPQTSTTAPAYFCIQILNSQSGSWQQPQLNVDWDVCGSGSDTNFLCDSTVR